MRDQPDDGRRTYVEFTRELADGRSGASSIPHRVLRAGRRLE